VSGRIRSREWRRSFHSIFKTRDRVVRHCIGLASEEVLIESCFVVRQSANVAILVQLFTKESVECGTVSVLVFLSDMMVQRVEGFVTVGRPICGDTDGAL
jgi:hypothetical protein